MINSMIISLHCLCCHVYRNVAVKQLYQYRATLHADFNCFGLLSPDSWHSGFKSMMLLSEGGKAAASSQHL